MSIAAVIVTYNRKKLLMENLDALYIQTCPLDSIIIIDNASTDGTKETLMKMGYFQKLPLDYVLMEHNSGGAGGFSYGVQYAYEKNYDWIILMDDDGKPYDENTIEVISTKGVELLNQGYKMIMINSLVTHDGKELSFNLGYTLEEILKAQNANSLLIGRINPFNCTLLSRYLIEKIGYPRSDYFISCDEREYNFRAKKSGAFIATVPASIYLHPKARDSVLFENGKYYEYISTPFKEYYFVRNSICINKNIKSVVKNFKNRFYVIIKFEDQKCKRIQYLFKSTCDALLGKMGKRI